MTQPTAQEPGKGIDEQIYYAQIIINAFSDGLAQSRCLSQVPIAVYTQADEYENRLFDTLEALGEQPEPGLERDYTYEVKTASRGKPNKQNKQEVQSPENPVFSITESIRKKADDECLNCDAEPPGIDLSNLLDGLLDDILDFLKNIMNMFKGMVPNMCNLAYLLSYICIPDLIKILAMILAYIIKILAALVLGAFALSAFIMGVLAAAIVALLKFVLALFGYVMAPITCLLESLGMLADAVPTKGNLKEQLNEEQYALIEKGFSGKNESKKSSASSYDDLPGEWASSFKQKTETGNEAIKEGFGKAENRIREASDGVEGSMEDLLGLIGFCDCEPKRSGASIFDKIASLVELTMLANLIRAVIDKKSTNLALDRLCRVQDDEENPYRRGESYNPDPFDKETIAKVVGDAIGAQTDILESEDGDIAVVFTPPKNTTPSSSRLSFYSCSLDDFARESALDKVIERGIKVAEENLKGRGNSPRSISINRPVKRVKIDQVGPDQQIMYFDAPAEKIGIQEIIDEIFRFQSTPINQSQKGFKLKSDVLPAEYRNNDSANPVDQDNDPDVADNSTPSRFARSSLEKGVVGISMGSLKKPVRLRCAPVEDISKILDDLNNE